MPLFTFFLEYRGGTYISQVTAPDHSSAPQTWAGAFVLDEDAELRPLFELEFRRKLSESMNTDLPTPIEGVVNTWAICAIHLEHPATIHFTQTETDP